MSDLIISVSGLRGIVGQALTPDVAVRYAAAFAASLPPGPVVLTRDGRATGRMLCQAISSSLVAMGRRVIDADVAATPTTGVLVRQQKAAGGIQVSASHNPETYNGMKLFSAQGRVIDAEAGEQVRQLYAAEQFVWSFHDALGSSETCTDTTSDHLRLILGTVDVERICSQGFHVLLDSNHGAGSLLGRPLLDKLGCQVTLLGETPNGQFAHAAEPTADNLTDVAAVVARDAAVIGFCQDPDADRLAVIDENGRYLGEEFTLALCLNHVLSQTSGDVVVNCATSRMAQDIAAAHGFTAHVAPVGEANVVDAMIEHNTVFGGEGNGGPIDPRVGFVRDSFVGMALILDAMAATGSPISQLADRLPQYAIHKSKVTLPADKISSALDNLETHFQDAKTNRMDGLRLDWSDRWLLIRGSNTEPIVRIIAEATTKDAAIQLCRQAAEVIG